MTAAPVVISDEDALSRRIRRDHLRRNGTVSSMAFKQRGTPLAKISVDVARLTNLEETIARGGGGGPFGVAQLLARVPRHLGFEVRHAPEEDNSAHALVVGDNLCERCALLAEASSVVRRP